MSTPDTAVMSTPASQLAQFAAGLAYESIPAEVVECAKACILDTVASMIHGAPFPWSKMVIDYVRESSAQGHASVVGTPFTAVPSLAAFANGALSHAFELDCTYDPSVGAHPGAGAAVPALAVAEAQKASGKDLLKAFVAGSEVMYRIADAGRNSIEKLGFHSPGLVGVFGGAVAAGCLLGLDAERLTNAIGIGGSLCSGRLEFSKSGGGMVKRLHIGRAAEGGLTAATLALKGMTGPATILEGQFGFLNGYCRGHEVERLTANLGSVWHTTTISHKRYACHSFTQVPVTAALELKRKHGISTRDIASITVAGLERMISHHNIPDPQDLAMAQYSVPFCVALAFCRDPLDPGVFSAVSLNDPEIRNLGRQVKLEVLEDLPKDNPKASRVTVVLKDGRNFTQDQQYFPGMPQRRLTRESLRAKFDTLTAALPKLQASQLFDSLIALENVSDVSELKLRLQ